MTTSNHNKPTVSFPSMYETGFKYLKNLHTIQTVSEYMNAMEQIRKEVEKGTLNKKDEIEIMCSMNAFYFGYISTPRDFKFYELLLEAGWHLPEDTECVYYPEQVKMLAAKCVRKVSRHESIN